MRGSALCGIGTSYESRVGAKQPIHSFLGGKGLGTQKRNEYMGWFVQIIRDGSQAWVFTFLTMHYRM